VFLFGPLTFLFDKSLLLFHRGRNPRAISIIKAQPAPL
jgi:hypothetical protein